MQRDKSKGRRGNFCQSRNAIGIVFPYLSLLIIIPHSCSSVNILGGHVGKV